MAYVPGGSVLDDAVATAVPDLCVDVTETTTAAYLDCVARKACKPASTRVVEENLAADEARERSAKCNAARKDHAQHPINCVDWAAADGYCKAQRKRLPTSLEWSWIAHGGPRGSRFPWGDAAADRTRLNALDEATDTAPVGSFPAGDSPQGVHDLAGNVSEWMATADFEGKEHVVRGYGFDATGLTAPASSVRSTEASETRGFRCVKVP
jgi:formylglycine-generating enzyme required for sulfatase activity